MFKNLENIDWDKRGASNVPILLRNMTLKHESIRHNAFTVFEESILYIDDYSPEGINFQQGLFDFLKADVQLLVIPFLLEMLRNEELYDRDRVVGLLCFMTRYREFAEEDKSKQIIDAIWNGRDLYISLLHDKDVTMRMEVIKLLCKYPEYAEFTTPHIHNLLEEETDDNRSAILKLLEDLLKQDIATTVKTNWSHILEKFTDAAYSHTLRITATVMLIDITREATPQSIVDFLVDTMINKHDTASVYYFEAVTPDRQARAIGGLGVLRGLPAAIKIIEETPYLENGVYALASAISLAFHYKEKIFFGIMFQKGFPQNNEFYITLSTGKLSANLSILNASQEALVETMVHKDWIWQAKTNLFKVFGLPQSRDELRALL